MGWTETLVNGYTKRDTKALVRKEVSDNYELVKDSMVGNVYYGAYRNKENGIISAIVVKTKWRTGNTWGNYFATKFVPEECGPVDANCPDSILKILSPTEHEYALGWREKCRENAKITKEKRKKNQELKALRTGSKISFTCQQDTTHYNKGELIQLKKIVVNKNGKQKSIWFDGTFWWPLSMIPNDYTVA